MPRSRGSEVPQRHSPRPPFHLRTSSSSESDPSHQRPIVDRSPKLGDRRSPRGSTPDSLHQKKLGTRVSDLEAQLGQAQAELKKLKDKLVSAECAKKEAQEELDKKKETPEAPPDTEVQPISPQFPPAEVHETYEKNNNGQDESPVEISLETDVFEVPVAKLQVEPKKELTDTTEEEDYETKKVEKCTDEAPLSEPEKLSLNDLAALNDEISSLKAKLGEKEEEVDALRIKNESLSVQIAEAAITVASALAKEEETVQKLSHMGEELDRTKANAAQLSRELQAMEAAKAALESEMKKLRVQTEQWRKAADAAAAVLSGGMEMNGSRVGERCGSMEKHLMSGAEFDPMWGDDLDDGYSVGKKKSSGIKMFGDLWKKKGQK